MMPRFKYKMFFLAAGFISLATFSTSYAQQPGRCSVTSGASSLDPGTLLDAISKPECTYITITVNAIDPLPAPVSLRSGMTLEGNASVVLKMDGTVDAAGKNCLLRIHNGTAGGVTLKNVSLENPDGAGICVWNDGGYLNGNIMTGVRVLKAKTRGIDLASSSGNTITSPTLVGVVGSATDGIYMTGNNNTVTGGSIESFAYGINVNNRGATGNTLSRLNLLKIRTDGILFAPEQQQSDILKAAFVPAQFTLTGVVPNQSTTEIYNVTTRADGTTDYQFRFSIGSDQFMARDADPTLLHLSDRRFVHKVVAADAITTASKLVRTVTLSDKTTLEFSIPYTPDADIRKVVGGSLCADMVRSQWFWFSYDRTTDNAGNGFGQYRGWDIDYDRDGLLNGYCNGCVDEFKKVEDLNRNCAVEQIESDPKNWKSQYDVDCDTIADHASQGAQTPDNCYKLWKPNTVTDYTETEWRSPPLEIDIDYFHTDPIDACTQLQDRNGTFHSWNRNQLDTDRDGLGDVCEGDRDNDGVANGDDNCPGVANTDQRDSDGNGIGDACEQLIVIPVGAGVDDADGDGVKNAQDNCPYDANANQRNADGDGAGDVCDADIDNDGLTNGQEDLNHNGRIDPGETDPLNPDSDNDTLCDGPGWGFLGRACLRPRDNCPLQTNRDQKDRDEDSIGDLCDAAMDQWLGDNHSDNDGIADERDNCPMIANPPLFIGAILQADWDRDGAGDACDPDDDNDGLDDATESGIFNPRRKDVPSACRNDPSLISSPGGAINDCRLNAVNADVDGDTVWDGIDKCVNYFNPGATHDARIAALPSNCGNYPADDLDGDGVRGSNDNCPTVASKFLLDLDGDGLGDACDLDDDNDNNSVTTQCAQILSYQSNPTDAVTPACVPYGSGGCINGRTCDFDESASLRMVPWDSNGDHENGDIFARPDALCDAGGKGYGNPAASTFCKTPADACPEYFDRPGQACGPTLAPGTSTTIPTGADTDADGNFDDVDNCSGVPNSDQSDVDADGVGDVCDPDFDVTTVPTGPTGPSGPKLQGSGGGCNLAVGASTIPISEVFLLASLGIFYIRRRLRKTL